MIDERNVPLSAAVARPASAQGLPEREWLRGAAHSAELWLAAHREQVWIALLILLAALAHGYNMFHYPYYESDEGTYMSQAWAVIRLGKLAPYTYWYDHSPGGWFQLAAWSTLTGGFDAFGSTANSGRVLMLLMQLVSTLMVYRITRAASRSVLAASVATLVFMFSAYGIYYHRRVLLDNIATFWMLLSIGLLVSQRVTLTRVWLSALALGVAVLSKELTIFLVPGLLYLVWYQTHSSQRWFATLGWLTIVGSVFSLYFLLATLKGELFPTGSWLGGPSEHVSLLGTLQYQASRGNDAGLFDPNSIFWIAARGWAVEEPLLVIAGTAAAVLSALLLPWHRLVGVLGLLTLSLWAFIGRGGVTLPFYLVPLLPLLAICLGLLVDLGTQPVAAALRRLVRAPRALMGALRLLAGAAVVACIALGYFSSRNPEFAANHLVLWTNTQADVNRTAVDWALRNLPRDSRIIIDQSMWLDLHDPADSSAGFTNAHYYWKVFEDPEIRDGVFGDDWRNVDYIITTNQMIGDTAGTLTKLAPTALKNSTVIASFDTGGWPVQVRRVQTLQTTPASADPLLTETWASYKQHFVVDGRVIDPGRNGQTTSEGQSYALLRAVYVDDRVAFDEVWSWTQANLVQPSGTLAWLYGPAADGALGVLDGGSASDADQDTALALLFAARRWNEPRYQEAAATLLDGMWAQQTAVVAGKHVLVAGPWARGTGADGMAVVNPSYFAPYAYRIFAEADPQHPWAELVDSSYDILQRAQAAPNLGGASGLVPNWLAIDVRTGALSSAAAFVGSADDVSFDASRIPFRIALDWAWNNEARARQVLARFDAPRRDFAASGKVSAQYRLDGTAAAEYEAISMYAGVLPGILAGGDHELARQMYAGKLLGAYHSDPQGAYWGTPDGYYDQNWAWFATAFVDGGMSNLWRGETVIEPEVRVP